MLHMILTCCCCYFYSCNQWPCCCTRSDCASSKSCPSTKYSSSKSCTSYTTSRGPKDTQLGVLFLLLPPSTTSPVPPKPSQNSALQTCNRHLMRLDFGGQRCDDDCSINKWTHQIILHHFGQVYCQVQKSATFAIGPLRLIPALPMDSSIFATEPPNQKLSEPIDAVVPNKNPPFPPLAIDDSLGSYM